MLALRSFRRLRALLDFGTRRVRTELRRLPPLPRPAARVLDLGSGEAPYASLFPHERYVTADLQSDADVRCDATTLPFAASAFDLVICTEMLEHVPDPDTTLQEIRRVLTDDGTLILATPLTWGVHAVWDYHRWTESGLRRLLAHHGFTVVALRSRGGVFLTAATILLVVPWQVFGDSTERRWWQSALFAAAHAIVVPAAALLAAFDRLDRRQHFTLGYVALCRRNAAP